MKLHADLTKRSVVHTPELSWVASPSPGVERRMLDRDGDEVARATSIVRYAASAAFPYHLHGGGEEFLVLEGLFLDEHGRYPAGTYVRNPIGTRHTPAAGPEGAVLFVKLRQMAEGDKRQFSIDTRTAAFGAGPASGITVLPLHQYGSECVSLERFAPFTQHPAHLPPGGREFLVLEGELFDEHGSYPAGSWVRNPHRFAQAPYTKSAGALLFVKIGHLPLS